jgi:hypothetical protein
MARLAIPWVDKTIAILASIPFAVEPYRPWLGGKVSSPRAVLGIQILVLIVVMVLRKPPVRITPNPWFWLLAFVTSYGFLPFRRLPRQRQRRPLPSWQTGWRFSRWLFWYMWLRSASFVQMLLTQPICAKSAGAGFLALRNG